MKSVLLFVVSSLLFIAAARAQVSISPLNIVAGKRHASDAMTISNDSTVPVAVTLDAKTLGIVDGKVAVLPLSSDVKLKLHDTAARIEPHSSFQFEFDIRCSVNCVTILVASISPIEKRVKAEDDGQVHAGLQLRTNLGEVVYACDRAKGCRDSFKEIWSK